VKLSNVTAAILAGGLGTRLQSVVADRPKVLALIAGRPYLAYLLDQLAVQGVRDVVLLTGYRAGQVRDTFGETYGKMRLHYSVEPSPLGTAGALRHALALFRVPQVLLLNGDSYIEVDFAALLEQHDRQKADVSLVLCRVDDTCRFGRVEVDADGRVVRFEEKRTDSSSGWINAGVYLFRRDLITSIPPARAVSLERDVLPRWITTGRVQAYQTTARFLDIGTPESYAAGERFFHVQQTLAAANPR
jgi:D-glycero-alpha-D-manno-heptose 1-phosphate guanylyltransferase